MDVERQTEDIQNNYLEKWKYMGKRVSSFSIAAVTNSVASGNEDLLHCSYGGQKSKTGVTA